MIRLRPTSIGLADSDIQQYLQRADAYQNLLAQGFTKKDIQRYYNDQQAQAKAVENEEDHLSDRTVSSSSLKAARGSAESEEGDLEQRTAFKLGCSGMCKYTWEGCLIAKEPQIRFALTQRNPAVDAVQRSATRLREHIVPPNAFLLRHHPRLHPSRPQPYSMSACPTGMRQYVKVPSFALHKMLPLRLPRLRVMSRPVHKKRSMLCRETLNAHRHESCNLDHTGLVVKHTLTRHPKQMRPQHQTWLMNIWPMTFLHCQ